MTGLLLPSPKAVKDMLADLLDRHVAVTTTVPFAPGPDGPGTIALYVDDSLRLAALIGLDLRLSAYAAAAIGLVPVGAADDAISDGTLHDPLRENLVEVLNVAASLFIAPGATRVRLHVVHPVGEPAPPAALAQALTLGRREDLSVKITGYGIGRLSVVLL